MRNLLRLLSLSLSQCIHCEKEALKDHFLCLDCLERIKPAYSMEYKAIPYLFSYRVFSTYDGPLRSAILHIKFYNNPFLARKLGALISQSLWEYIHEVKPDLITFPELNLRRFWVRGFNHVEEILKGAEVPYQRIFKRKGFDPPMANMEREQRKKAVLSHTLRKEWADLLEGAKVLVVDDILTTGETISRLCELLVSVGVKETYAFFLARSL